MKTTSYGRAVSTATSSRLQRQARRNRAPLRQDVPRLVDQPEELRREERAQRDLEAVGVEVRNELRDAKPAAGAFLGNRRHRQHANRTVRQSVRPSSACRAGALAKASFANAANASIIKAKPPATPECPPPPARRMLQHNNPVCVSTATTSAIAISCHRLDGTKPRHASRASFAQPAATEPVPRCGDGRKHGRRQPAR